VVESKVEDGRVPVPAGAVELRARVGRVAETSRVGRVVEDDDQRRLVQARVHRLCLLEPVLPHLHVGHHDARHTTHGRESNSPTRRPGDATRYTYREILLGSGDVGKGAERHQAR
jgi:hypothetical protein